MKKVLFSIFTAVLLLSCQDKKNEVFDTNLLNGYWEIQQVKMADGSEKDYKMSETVDYFEIKQDTGFRKKVNPQLDGTYLVNDSEEDIKVEKLTEGTYIFYKTDYATWKEKIKKLTNEQLILENEQHIQYQYKRPIPFTIK